MTTVEIRNKTNLVSIPRKLCQHLAARGVRNTIHRLWRAVSSRWREMRLGIHTNGSIAGSEMNFDNASFGYQPVPFASFDAAMRLVQVNAGKDVFVDYGCGMGRAVVLAATYPFRRVIGVERSEMLSQIARNNVARATSRLCCSNVAIETADAREYEVPADATHIFLFNPFDEPVMKDVLMRIRRSLDETPRQVSIIYALPKCRRDPLVDLPWLRVAHEIETLDSDWQRLTIYESR